MVKRRHRDIHRDDAARAAEAKQSSNIEAHEYSPETGQLTITYRGGRWYGYLSVPEEIAAGLEKSESKGRFVNAHIVDKFEAKKLDLDAGQKDADK